MKKVALVIPESGDPRLSVSWDISEPGMVTIRAPADSVFKVEIDDADMGPFSALEPPPATPAARDEAAEFAGDQGSQT